MGAVVVGIAVGGGDAHVFAPVLIGNCGLHAQAYAPAEPEILGSPDVLRVQYVLVRSHELVR